MEMKGFPTSADIYLELEGKKVAVVQSYTARASKSSRNVEAFGEREPVERCVLCNSQILAESSIYQGEPAFPDGESVLEELTPREMEGLLRQLAFGREQGSGAQNPAFDPARFCTLEELG